eukprot:jgi/Ulvmu1/11533/UM078_0022.1
MQAGIPTSLEPNIKSLPQYPMVPGARPPVQLPGPSCEPASCAATGALTPPTPPPSASALPSTPYGTWTLARSPPAPSRPSGPADNAAPLGNAATAAGTSEGPAAAAALVAAAISAVVASSEVKAAAADTADAMDVDVPGEAAISSGARELSAAAAAAAAVDVKTAAPAGQCTVRRKHLPQVGPVATGLPQRLPQGRRGRAAAACARPLPPRSQHDPERGDLLVMLPCDTIVADVCVTCPVAPSRVAAAANTPGAAAQLMDDRKQDKYGRSGTGACRFVSLSHETFGRVGMAAQAGPASGCAGPPCLPVSCRGESHAAPPVPFAPHPQAPAGRPEGEGWYALHCGGREPPGSHVRGARDGVLEWGRLEWGCCYWGVGGGRFC